MSENLHYFSFLNVNLSLCVCGLESGRICDDKNKEIRLNSWKIVKLMCVPRIYTII